MSTESGTHDNCAELQSKDDYIKLISHRGGPTGLGGGLLDFLTWCDKNAVKDATLEEARRFWEDPMQPYAQPEADNHEGI